MALSATAKERKRINRKPLSGEALERRREYDRLRGREKHQNDPSYREARARRKFKSKYGITWENRDEMIATQGYRCASCGLQKELVVDHCHRTGVVRGMICDACNKAIGFMRDDPALLRKLAYYLECA